MKTEEKGSQKEYNIDKTIHELFQDQVLKTSSSIAVEFKDTKITYKDLNYRADILADILLKNELSPNSIVGIVTNRSIEMLVSILAVLKAGGAYLPIDPEYPEDRISYMLTDSNVRIVISQKSLENKIKHKSRILFLDDINFYSNITNCIEKIDNANDLSYVIYTSGSTGKPKGVMIEHKSVVNFIKGMCNVIDFSKGKSILALTTISFDIFVLETLLALTQGLTVVLADENQQKNPKLLADLIIKSRIDMLQMTPSRMQLLNNHDKELKCLKNVKEIMIGGEAFPQYLLEKLKAATSAKIYNMYGPTETTVWSTVSELTEKNSIDIGRPIINTQIYIIDGDNNLVLNGTEGELCIGGDGVARGYLNRPELTEERFVPNPFTQIGRIYKTGDLARWLPDGNIECLGRIDNQVKIRGYRIELREIETALIKHQSIKQAVVTAWQGKDNAKYLCAYYLSEEELLSADLRNYLGNSLPEYMVPSYFIRIDCIPQTPNGKVDSNSLPNPDFMLTAEHKKQMEQYEEKLGVEDVEFKIRKIVLDNVDILIPIDSVDFNSNLSDVGINSITFIKIVVTIEVEFGLVFGEEDLDINRFQTIQSIVDYVKSRKG